MAKKAKPIASKPAAEKSSKSKDVGSKSVATKPAKVATPKKPAAKKPAAAKASAPRAAKKLAAAEALLPLESAPSAAPLTLADRYASFEDARSATIDALLASIEAAEARLLDVKRAVSFEQLEPLANGDAGLHS